MDTAPVWHLGGLFTGSTSWRKITPMKKTYITISALSARIAAASFHRFFRKEHPDCAQSSVRPLTLRRTHPRNVKWNRVRPSGRETRRLEPRRSSQLSQDSESGFLREGTRLRRVGGAREARARKGRRACLVGLRRSLASGLSGPNSSTGTGSPGVFDKRASVVRSGQSTTSAKATYAASYAVRLARHNQIRGSIGPCRWRWRSSSSSLRTPASARSAATVPARTYRRSTLRTSRSRSSGPCREILGSCSRSRILAPVRVPRTSSTTTDASRTAVTPRSAPPPFFPKHFGGRGIQLNRRQLGDPRENLVARGPGQHQLDLPEYVIRHRHADEGRTGFQPAVNLVRHVADLKHFRHTRNDAFML